MKRLLPLLALAALAVWTAPPAAWAGETAAPAQKHAVKKKPAVKSGKRAAKKPVRRHFTKKPAPQPTPVNPYLPAAQASAPVAPLSPPPAAPIASKTTPQATHLATPAAPAIQPFTYTPPFSQTWQPAAPNPYLVNAVRPAPAVVAAAPAAAPAAAAPAPMAPPMSAPAPAYQAAAPTSSAPAFPNLSNFSLRSLLPDMPPSDQSILPSIKKVQPTGEKPLYVLTFKCPTELVGVSTPPIKALRGLIDGGFDLANSSNLLPFNMQQVCQ